MNRTRTLEKRIRGWLPQNPLEGETGSKLPAKMNHKNNRMSHRKVFLLVTVTTLCLAITLIAATLFSALAVDNISYYFNGPITPAAPNQVLSLEWHLQISGNIKTINPLSRIIVSNATIQSVMIPGLAPSQINECTTINNDNIIVGNLSQIYGSALGSLNIYILLIPNNGVSSFSISGNVSLPSYAHDAGKTYPVQLIYNYNPSDNLYIEQANNEQTLS
jgi:hypothetical protein